MKRITSILILSFVLSCAALPAFAVDNTTDHITVIVPPMATPAPTLSPVDIQTSDIDDEIRQIVKTYNVPLELDFEPLIPLTFEESGITYTRTDLNTEDIVVTDIKDVTVDKSLTNSSKVGAAAFASSIDYDQDGYVGVLARNDGSFSVWSNGTKQVSKTVTESKKYSNLPNNDMGQIAKSYNGLTLANVDFYDQSGASVKGYSDGQVRSYSATAHYSGVKVSTVSTGYSAKVSYTGNVVKETITEREVKVTYTGKIPVDTVIAEVETVDEPAADEPSVTAEPESTPTPEAPFSIPRAFPLISISVLFTAGLIELIHLIARRTKKS